jgi:hypothetical protein
MGRVEGGGGICLKLSLLSPAIKRREEILFGEKFFFYSIIKFFSRRRGKGKYSSSSPRRIRIVRYKYLAPPPHPTFSSRATDIMTRRNHQKRKLFGFE